MKKYFLPFLTLLLALPLFGGCGKYDYYAHVSDERSDLFCAECEDFSLTVSCVRREYPYLLDGIAAPVNTLLEAVLTETAPSGAEYELYFLEDVPRGGDMSFRSVTGDHYYSRTVQAFPEGSLSVRVVKDGTPRDLALTSVKTEQTISPQQALHFAVEAEKEYIRAHTKNGKFCGEFQVRLLRRDKNYYYVGIIDEQGNILSLLLDSGSGKVLARRERA